MVNVGWRLGPCLPLVVNDADQITSVANLEDTRVMNIRVVGCAAIRNPSENPARITRRGARGSWTRMWVSKRSAS